MTESHKFKILFDLSRHDELREYFLPYMIMEDVTEESIKPDQDYILRSALKIENERQLNSGVGHSISKIKNYQDFLKAKEKVLKQVHLDFAIFQPYWAYEKHITILLDENIFYGDVIGDKKEFIMHSNVSSSGEIEIIESINKVLFKIKKYYSRNLLIELGYKMGKVKVFQVTEVKDPTLIKFFYQELYIKAQLAQKNLQNTSLWQKLKREYKAKRFREKNLEATISNIFQNWLYIFHYYRLFCIKKKLSVSSISFESFLKSLNEQNQTSKMAKLHIEIANKFREHESLPEVSGSFFDSREVYLGKGARNYIYGKTAIHLEDLSVEKLEQNKKNLILSTYNGILGHPCLYMAQENINFVGGLPDKTLESLKAGDEISVDFNLRQTHVKSN